MSKPPAPSDTAQVTRTVLRLDEVVMRHARRQPSQPALSQDDRLLDYKALAQCIERASARLQAWGIGSGDRVACLSWNSIEVLVLLLALARLGAMLAPLNHRLAAAEWDQLMQDCTPRCLLHDEAWVSAAQALGERHGLDVHTLEELMADLPVTPVTAAAGPLPADAEVNGAEALGDPRPVLLVYTSGTTGQPRAAVHTQANLIANMQAASRVLELGAQDRVLTMLPLFHVGGLCIQTLPALWAGAQVRIQARFDPEDTLLAIERYRIGYTVVVPAVMKALLEHPRWQQTDLSSLRGVSAGSSTLPMHLVQGFLARGVPLGNVYGATETGPFSIAFRADPALALRGSCGWPAPGLEARLGPLDGGAGNEDTGEVWLRGPAVVRHYWPDLPAVDEEGWFHSGDVARVDQDGSWTIVGRSKDMIISGGENIYPAEIEGLLAQHPAVAECAVLGVPDERWGESVVAVVVLHPQAQASDEDLLAEVRARLARYKQPRRVVRRLQLPKTALGKVQKNVLRETLSEPGTPAPP